MARRKRSRMKPPMEKPRIPDRERLYVSEVAKALAAELDITESGAKSKIYRGIESGQVYAVNVLGTLMIPRPEVDKILNGERA